MSEAFRWPVRVYYEDTDAGGVVYYANYLRFMERARTEWLRSLGVEQDALRREAGVLFAVVQIRAHYRRPARFNETLSVTCTVTGSTRTTVSFEQQVLRDGELLCDGEVRAVCVDAESFRPRAIPESILKEMAR